MWVVFDIKNNQILIKKYILQGIYVDASIILAFTFSSIYGERLSGA